VALHLTKGFSLIVARQRFFLTSERIVVVDGRVNCSGINPMIAFIAAGGLAVQSLPQAQKAIQRELQLAEFWKRVLSSKLGSFDPYSVPPVAMPIENTRRDK
jgi:hypothetical protein